MSRSEEASWNLLDALDWRGINASTETTSPGENELIPGSTFKSWEKQSSREPWEDMEIPNFPDLDVLPDGQRTSEPVSKVVVETEKKDLLDLVTRERLRELLDAPMGMVRFEEWLEDEGQQGSAALLRYYKDVHAQAQLMDEVRAISHGLRSIYFDHPEGYAFKGFTHGPTQSLSALGDAVEALNRAEDEVLDRLYETEFKRFISGRITDQARACLGSFADQTDRGDLGEIFCLADPRQRDTPLVYVSDGFCELSEYPRNRLVGRNCRFLQGPGTDQEAVRLLREAIAAGKEHTSLLLNYTRTGKPFWNLLNMIPLRNAKGEIDFYLGAQINVTRTLTSKQTFEALTGMVERNQPDVTPKYEISDDVLSAMERITKGSSTFRHISGIASPRSATSPRATSPNPGAMSSLSSNLGVPGEQPQKGHKWLKPKRSFNSIRAGLTTSVDEVDVGAQPAEITQEVESAVKEHMANFAAVYSKMLVFKASDRSIGYVTPALLAYLGYSIKSPSDRFASPLISTDLLDLLTSPSSAETTITRQTVSKSITEHTPHSFFAGLKSRSRTGAQGVEMDGMARGLIHMTPVKDEKDVVVYYVMVVG